jgi:signal transduction histidine kinase
MSSATLLSRVRASDPQRRDLLLALFVLVESQLEVALLLPAVAAGTRALVHGVLVLLPLALVIRRRWPLVSLLLAQAVFVLVQANERQVTDNLYLPLFAVLFLIFSAAMHTPGRRFWAVPLIGWIGGSIALAVDDYDDQLLADIGWMGLIFAGAVPAAGRLLAGRLNLQRALREKAEHAERERARQAELAVLEERERIAGDLHDIVAHALSGMVVQASAARRLAATNPQRAREAFSAVESSGREALGELRRLLGVLRHDDEEIALAPQPSLAHVESLVRRVRSGGLPVNLRIEGSATPLPAGVDVTAYRVVQEALGVAAAGGDAGRADVVVRYEPGAVELEVRDDGAGGDPTRPLLGMRERVALYGGQLRATRPRDGGHVVVARLPLSEGPG